MLVRRHPLVRSFVRPLFYVHCTTFLGQNGAHHLRLPLRLVSATVDVPADDAAKFERKSARSEALQAASGLAASGVAFTPESLTKEKPAEALYDVRAAGGCSEYRGSRLPVLGVSASVRERLAAAAECCLRVV